MFKYILVICAIFRNEARYLAEWIAYHQCVGVDHIYLVNDHSSDNFDCYLKHFIKSGFVTLSTYAGADRSAPQSIVYNQCLRNARERQGGKRNANFIAFIDVDEFLVAADSTTKGNVSTYVKELQKRLQPNSDTSSQNLGFVAVPWVNFGSHGKTGEFFHTKDPSPEKLVMESYVYRKKYVEPMISCCQYKSIVNTEGVKEFAVHAPRSHLKKSFVQVDIYGNVVGPTIAVKGLVNVSKSYTPPTDWPIRLHHYKYKSLEYMKCKAKKPHPARRKSNRYPSWRTSIKGGKEHCCHKDTSILRHQECTKQKLRDAIPHCSLRELC